ncbi:cation:proton antiporter [Sediminicoccus sp. BL-A-41-H5]|uniref:cation:proton antiporter n=1 Tax=Sediminicoccus sp. BL-A-41-H5 TaxID=3421106 RepID=UPI003D6731F8
MPSPFLLALTGAGLLIALVVWLPLLVRRLPLSMPILSVGLGALFFLLPFGTPLALPQAHPRLVEHLTEIVVIIALMGAGLKIDRPFHWRRWAVTWRLLGLAMPLTILAIAALGVWGLGLPLALAVLLGGALAPTDPVLAGDVQVGPPRSGPEDEVRFGLTSEAGLNDGLAFPFIHLAIALGAVAGTGGAWFGEWLAWAVLWKIGAGVLVGWGMGLGFGWVTFHVPPESALARTGDGMIALSATFLSYGAAEMAQGYGFLAVFVTALAYRHAHRQHDFHDAMHAMTDQVERLLMTAVLLLLGGALTGGLLAPLTWADWAMALLVLLVVRPVAGWLALLGLGAPAGERAVLACFGIRGIGSFYYLAYGLNRMETAEAGRLWALVGLIVLLSVLLHGLSVTPILRRLDAWRGRRRLKGSARRP